MSAPDPFRDLRAFSDLQRQLATSNFSALTAAQRALDEQSATASKIAGVLATGNAVAKNFARSIDFKRLAASQKALSNEGVLRAAKAGQTQWAESLAKAIDVTALNKAIALGAAMDTTVADSLRRQTTEVFARIADQNGSSSATEY